MDRQFFGNGHKFSFESEGNGFAFLMSDGRTGSGTAAGAAQAGALRSMTGTTSDGTIVSASLGELGAGASAYITFPGEAPLSFTGVVEAVSE